MNLKQLFDRRRAGKKLSKKDFGRLHISWNYGHEEASPFRDLNIKISAHWTDKHLLEQFMNYFLDALEEKEDGKCK